MNLYRSFARPETAFALLASLLVFTQSSVSHAAVTSFEVNSYVGHSVAIIDSNITLATKGSTSPTAFISTSFADEDGVGVASAHSSTEIIGASASGVTIIANIKGNAVAGPLAGLVRVDANSGNTRYTFTIDAPTIINLHGHVQRNFTSPFTNFGVGFEIDGSFGSIPGLWFGVTSASEPDFNEGHMDSGPILLQPGTYYLLMGIDGQVVLTSPNDAGSFSISLSVTLSIPGSDNPSKSPIIISNGSTAPFSKSLALTASETVGRAIEVVGTATVLRADGSQEPIGVATLIGKGDVIETGQDGAVNILFADGTTLAITESARLSVDQFVFDPSGVRPKTSFFSLLQAAFVYTEGLLGKEDGTINIETPVGAIGIRGDATPYINKDYLDVAAKMETVASPVSLVAPVPAAHESGEMSFDYVFLTPTGSLDVFLDEALLFSVSASEHPVNVFQQATIALQARSALPSDTAKLTFHFDGPVGSKLLIDNIVFPGLQNGDLSQLDNGWFWVGPSRLDLVATISDTRFAELLQILSAPDTLILTSPPTFSKSRTASFSFTSTAASSTFACALDSGAFAACTSPKTYTKLKAGSHTFQVQATDGAGNTDPTPASYTWTIDTTPPNTTITSRPPRLTSDRTATFQFTSTEPNSTFQCSLDGRAFVACTSPQVYSSLTRGLHIFRVRAMDPAGNLDPTLAAATWTIR